MPSVITLNFRRNQCNSPKFYISRSRPRPIYKKFYLVSSNKYVTKQGVANRDVKKTRPHGYPRVIPATGRVWGEDFAPAGNGDGDFKYPHVKRGGGGDHYTHTRGYPL